MAKTKTTTKDETKPAVVQPPPSVALKPVRPPSGRATVQAMFEKQAGQISKALAGQINTDRFIRTALTAYSNGSDYFKKADPVSLLGACIQAAGLGLSVDPVLGEAWLIPRRNSRLNCISINFQIGYRGLLKLARRNANFLSAHAELVYDDDFFEYDLGSEPRITHRKKAGDKPPGEIKYSYAVVRYKTGPAQIHVSPLWEIYQSRERSESYRNGRGPWIDHFGGMCLVVPLRAILKLEAIDDVVLRQLGREEAQEVADDVINYDIDGELVLPSELPPVQDDPSNIDDLKRKFGDPNEVLPDASE